MERLFIEEEFYMLYRQQTTSQVKVFMCGTPNRLLILKEMNMVVCNKKPGYISFGSDKSSTPLLNQLRDKGRKRSILDAFGETADALDHLKLSPRAKKVVRRPPPVLTVYVRKENEKAYNAIFMETVTLDHFKEAVSLRYGLKGTSIRKVALRSKSG